MLDSLSNRSMGNLGKDVGYLFNPTDLNSEIDFGDKSWVSGGNKTEINVMWLHYPIHTLSAADRRVQGLSALLS